MKTKVKIPFSENKGNRILLLLQKLQDEGILSFVDIGERWKTFNNGIDLVFEIPSEKLSLLLRDLDDSKFVYKPESLKSLASKHLSRRDSYSQIRTDDYKIIEVTGTLFQTTSDEHFVMISDNAPFLTEEIKEKLIAAVKCALELLPNEATKCNIDLKRIQYSSIGVTESHLINAVKQWAKNSFGIVENSL